VNQRWTCLLPLVAFGVLASVQLFGPPIVGLADNGDFPRAIGRFGYAQPQDDREPRLIFAYLAPFYTHQPLSQVRQKSHEFLTSHTLLVALAVVASRITSPSGTLFITTMGAVHMAAIFAALARLLFVTRHLRAHLLFGVALVLILTDVGYLAYCNSFFSEPASCIFALWFTAEAIAASREQALSGKLLAAALLFICAKPQNVPLALPLACYVYLMPRRSSVRTRLAASTGLLLAAAAVLHSVQPEPKLEVSYNLLFSAILPESRDPRADLEAMGMDPELVRFKNTRAWSADSGFYDEQVRKALKSSGPAGLAGFYMQRPTRAWRHLTTLFPTATRIRPECCANFEPSSGLPPGAQATSFSLWSKLHEQVFGHITKFWLLGLCGILAVHLRRGKPGSCADVLAVLSALCITAFLTAAFGDENEPVKHLYLFNLLSDITLILLLALCRGSLPATSDIESFLAGGSSFAAGCCKVPWFHICVLLDKVIPKAALVHKQAFENGWTPSGDLWILFLVHLKVREIKVDCWQGCEESFSSHAD